MKILNSHLWKISQKYSKYTKLKYQYTWLKLTLTIGVFFLIVLVSSSLGEFFTFLILDILLSSYLSSLFRSSWGLLFFIHPVFVYLTGFGFRTPYTDIGVGYTYFLTFSKYVSSNGITINWEAIASGILSFTSDYLGAIPILWFPKILFLKPSPTAFYYSLSLWSLVCSAIAVNFAIINRVLRNHILLTVALCMTVSPTFLEINSSLHRYHLMVLGLFLVFIAYIRITRPTPRPLISLPTMLFGVLCLAISKVPLFISVGLFVFLDLWLRNKIPFMSLVSRINPVLKYFLIIGLVAFSHWLASNYIVPEVYVTITSNTGGGFFANLTKLPLLGLVFRILIAVQSPVPWVAFSQWQLYGFNGIFLGVHVLSAVFSFWLLLSLYFRRKYILKEQDDTRSCAVFGVAVMFSLSFSSIGFHVYWAPAVPFLAPILCEKYCRVSFIYPVLLAIILDIFIVCSQWFLT